ncbi:MAG: ribokinase [Ktedonobacterales bacterium]|nr:ribokinase [Ktedonobacterales bacterium]
MAHSPPTVVVIGSSNIDLVVRVPHLPLPGETILGSEVKRIAGGKGANQAVAAQRAGADVAFIGCLGDDDYGDVAAESLSEAGVNLTHLRRVAGVATGLAFITVAESGENSIVVAPGANASVSEADIATAQPMIAEARIIVAQLEIPVAMVMHAFTTARGAKVSTLLNPAPAQPLSDALLLLVDILVCNETEAAVLTSTTVTDAASAVVAARQLHVKGPRQVIVTLGRAGALISDGNATYLQPAFAVEAVDTTAAGDAFIGALVTRLAAGDPMPVAARFAAGAGALAVTRVGAQISLPMQATIVDFLAHH